MRFFIIFAHFCHFLRIFGVFLRFFWWIFALYPFISPLSHWPYPPLLTLNFNPPSHLTHYLRLSLCTCASPMYCAFILLYYGIAIAWMIQDKQSSKFFCPAQDSKNSTHFLHKNIFVKWIKMTTSLVNSLTEQIFMDSFFVCSGVALSFQRKVTATACTFFVVLSSLPLVYKDYIQCFCAPENPFKDILETSCLKGNLFSNFTGSDNNVTVTKHDQYQNIPYIFLWFVVLNMLPSATWLSLDNQVVMKLIEGMKNFNQQAVNSRVNRLTNFMKEDIYQLSRFYILRIICLLLSLFSTIYQVYFCEYYINSAFTVILQYLLGISDKRQLPFPDKAFCTASKKSYTGHEETENFFCFLTMNEVYKNMFQMLFIIHILGTSIAVSSLANHILIQRTWFKR